MDKYINNENKDNFNIIYVHILIKNYKYFLLL